MSKLTNKNKLPAPIVAAVSNDDYSAGESDITVTSLLKPPRQRALELQHSDDITEDVSDKIFILLGKAIHKILEQAETEAITEKRIYVDVLGWKVGGQFDRLVLAHGLLQDYKVTSVYAIKDGAKEEHEAQLNLLRYILEQNGVTVTKLQIVAILRDWSKRQAQRDRFYPQSQVAVLDVPVWSDEKTKAFLEERVRIHQEAVAVLEESPELFDAEVLCTDEDRWARPTKYALTKPKASRALRLFDSKDEAEAASANQKGTIVEERRGEQGKCQNGYCPVADYCTQYQKIKAGDEQ